MHYIIHEIGLSADMMDECTVDRDGKRDRV